MDKATSFIFCPSLGHCRSYEIRNCSKSLFALGLQFYVTTRLDNCIAFMVKFYDLGLQFYVTESPSTIHFLSQSWHPRHWCLNSMDNITWDCFCEVGKVEGFMQPPLLEFLAALVRLNCFYSIFPLPPCELHKWTPPSLEPFCSVRKRARVFSLSPFLSEAKP